MREVLIPDGEAAGLTLPTLIEQLQAIQAASQQLNPSQVLTPFVSVLRPGAIGHSPAVPITAVHAGFDWDAGRVLFSCEFALTKLTKEDVAAIRQSVSAGSSWHAYQAQKHQRDRIAELEQGYPAQTHLYRSKKIRCPMQVFPVIHFLDRDTAISEADLASRAGAAGVFLISHGGDDDALVDVAVAIKRSNPSLPVGINLLTRLPLEAALTVRKTGLDMVWADYMGVDSRGLTDEGRALSDLAKKIRRSASLHRLPSSTVVSKQIQTAQPAMHSMLGSSLPPAE